MMRHLSSPLFNYWFVCVCFFFGGGGGEIHQAGQASHILLGLRDHHTLASKSRNYRQAAHTANAAASPIEFSHF